MYPLARSIASSPILVPSPPWQATQPNPFAAWISALYNSTGFVRLSTPSAEWQTAQVSPGGCAFRTPDDVMIVNQSTDAKKIGLVSFTFGSDWIAQRTPLDELLDRT